jgi:hypothetical protein
MKKLILPILVIITAVSFNSCDKIDTPLPEGELDTVINTGGLVWDDSSHVESSSTVRKVLIEEFTGHTCTNCPLGAAQLESLILTYGDQIVPMGIHSDATFCEPRVFADGTPATVINGVAAYTTDFRTSDGDAYRNTFGVNGIPKGFVSRISNGTPFSFGQWDSEFQTIQGDTPPVTLGISTLYNDSARIVKTIVKTDWLTSSTGNYKLQVQLVEDSIVDWQLNLGVDQQDYLHRHVFRGSMNGTWGTDIPSANQGDSDTQEFTYILPANFKKKDCIVVVFVYKDNPDYEIVQVEELHVVSH